MQFIKPYGALSNLVYFDRVTQQEIDQAISIISTMNTRCMDLAFLLLKE